MKKVVLTCETKDGFDLEQKILEGLATIVHKPCKTEEDLIESCKDADAVICSYEPFTLKVLNSLPKLKVISTRSVGVNFIDVNAAREMKIVVTNIPKFCINEVADHTVALILAVNRRLMQFHNSVQIDRLWRNDLYTDIMRLGELTVGLLGFGNIPRLVTNRLNGFGCKMIAYDPFVNPKVAEDYGVELVGLDDVYQNADYISCHLPLNKSTERMINKDAFVKMKNGVTIINTGRGMIIEALDSKKVSNAALDVLADEYPDVKKNKLVGRENVILTPHIAYYSQSSVRDMRLQSAENVLYYLRGEYDKCNIVNGVMK